MTVSLGRREASLGFLVAGIGVCLPARAMSVTQTEALTTFKSGAIQVNALVYRPGRDVRGPGVGAAVVMMHGAGGVQREYEGLKAAGEALSRHGYVVLIPNYFEVRGDDGVRSRRTMNTWRAVGLDAVEFLIEQGFPAARVGIWGVSLGGYVAVDGALGAGRAAAAVSVVSGTAVYAPRRPRRRIPVLMIYGQRDDHVPPETTKAWADVLLNDGVPVTLRQIDGAGHIFSRDEWTTMLNLTLDYFRRTLSGPAESI